MNKKYKYQTDNSSRTCSEFKIIYNTFNTFLNIIFYTCTLYD